MVFIQHAHSLTALGDDHTSWSGLCEGTVALQRMPVPNVEGEDLVPQAWMADTNVPGYPRWMGHLQTLVAGLPDRPWGSEQYPIFVTSSNYGIDHLFELSIDRDPEAHIRWSSPHRLLQEFRKAFGWGPNITIYSHACVTGQLGLIQAERAVASGRAVEAMVFSFDFLSPFVIGGFHSLKILNEGMPQPYHDGETGSIGLGEGTGVVVLGRERSPFRVESQALFNEMFHFTANAPDGSGFQSLFERLAEPLKGRKAWVKGHGTGTLEAGRLEAEAVERFLPGAPLVSWKGSLGHTLGSCAVVELAIALQAIRNGQIPGTVNAQAPYFSDAVAGDSFSGGNFDSVVLTSNAFGGAHAAMLISHE
jgi:3-oxoacyl-(acyl-carrier-protein) synthase